MPELPVPHHQPRHPAVLRPPRDAPRAQVAHAIGGRVRLRLARFHPGHLERVRHRLAAEPGIHGVEVDHRTGSVLVWGAVTAELLGEIGRQEGLFDLIPPRVLRPLEDDMTKALEQADLGIRHWSGGRVGLMGLVVGSLAALAVVQTARGRFDVPAPTLLWYMLSAAMMLRSRPAT